MIQPILVPSALAMLLTPLIAAVVCSQQEFERNRKKAQTFASQPGHKRAAARYRRELSGEARTHGTTSR